METFGSVAKEKSQRMFCNNCQCEPRTKTVFKTNLLQISGTFCAHLDLAVVLTSSDISVRGYRKVSNRRFSFSFSKFVTKTVRLARMGEGKSNPQNPVAILSDDEEKK